MTENLTLADRLHELTFRPYLQFGVTMGLRKSGPAYAEMQRRFLMLRMKLREAKRFVLDDQFIISSVHAAQTTPDVIEHYSRLAFLPFPAVWVEYNRDTRNATLDKLGTLAKEPDDTPKGQRNGFLLIREHALTEHPVWTASFVGQQINGDAWIGPIQYRLRCPVKHRNKEADGIAVDIGACSWGYTTMRDSTKYTSIHPDLDGLCTIEGDPYFIVPYVKILAEHLHKIINHAVGEGRGDMRWLVTMLKMINHVPVSYHHAPTIGSRTVKLKHIPLLDFSTVQIVAGAPRSIGLHDDQSYSPTGVRHRQHDVRGFNRVLHRGTEREFTTWVKEHKRGDPSLGVVNHDYEVVR